VNEQAAQIINIGDATDESRRQALHRELCALLAIGSIDELRAFGVIARRVMGKGRESYGPTDLKTDRRDFKTEKADEKTDWLWYDALDEIRSNDERLEKLRSDAALELAEATRIAEANKHPGVLPEPLATFELREPMAVFEVLMPKQVES
jgi:hypothetical protein